MKLFFKSSSDASKNIYLVSFGKQKGDLIEVLPDGRKTILISLEEPKQINHRRLILLARRIIAFARKNHIKKLGLSINDLLFPSLNISKEEAAELFAMNAEMANYEFVKFKTAPKGGWNFVEEIVVQGNVSVKMKQSFLKGQLIGQAVNQARDLANMPGADMTPSVLADTAKRLSKGTGVKVTVLDERKMKALGMGGVLGVGQGSAEKPRFIVMEYHGAGKSEKPIVLVGKAITFDTGGINLKPSDAINDMHMDMSGGAAVMSSVLLASQLKLKKNIVALIPAAENMPSGSSFRPGDIVKTLSGKTIEVANTDAEGRIILADALAYAERFHPKLVIDIATLTGAAWVTLGYRASALFTKDKALQTQLEQAGEMSGDYVWPMPLWDEYEDEIKGTFADVHNIGKYSRLGGAITAAMFLYQFAKNYPWAHIDIAPRTTTFEGEWLAKGAYGSGVRLLMKALENL